MCVYANVSRIHLLGQPKLLCDFKLPKTAKQNDTMSSQDAVKWQNPSVVPLLPPQVKISVHFHEEKKNTPRTGLIPKSAFKAACEGATVDFCHYTICFQSDLFILKLFLFAIVTRQSG